MSTNYIAPIWRMPRNANKNKLSNYSINFNGSSEYIDCGTDLFTDSTIPSISISVWIKTTTGSANAMVSKDLSSAGNRNFLLQFSGNDLYWQTSSDGNSLQFITVPNSTFNLLDGEWHHIVVTYEAGATSGTAEKKIYIDGAVEATDPAATIPNMFNTPSVPINIGRRGDSVRYYSDNMSQVCIFDYALSTDQINYLYNKNNPMAITGAEPIAYWPIGDNSNPNANAGYPNLSVGADSVFDFIPNDYINLGEDVVPATPAWTSLTVSAWVKKDATGSYGRVIGKDDGGSNRVFLLQVQNNDKLSGSIRTVGGSAWDNVQTTTDVAIGEWQHVAMTYTANGLIRLYINGQVEASGSNSIANLNPATTDTLIGAKGNITNLFDGQISNVQIWDVEISPIEMIEVYNNGQPLMTGTQPQEANLQAWYKLNQSANYDQGVSGIAFEVDQIGLPDVGGSGDHAYVNPSLSPLSFECQDLNSVGTGSPNYDLAFPVNNGVRWKSLKVNGRYSDLYLSANVSLQNGSTSFGFAGARLIYVIDGGSEVIWQDISVNPSDPNSLIAFNPTVGSLSCESSIQIFIDCGTANYSTARVRIDNVTIKEGGSSGTNIYNEDFGNQSGAGWNGTYTAANSETYVNPVWQIPDNRSSYPQSFDFSKTPQEYIDLGKEDFFDGNNEITFSVWINKKNWSNTGFEGIISKYGLSGATIQYRIAYPSSAGKLQFYLQGGPSGGPYAARIDTVTLTSAQQASEWLHICWRHNANTGVSEVIFNGDYTTLVSLTNIAANPYAQPQTTTTNMIGNVSNGLQPFDGAISNYQRFNSYLDNATVEALYNDGVPSTTAIAPTSFQAWYKLDNTETYLKPAPSQTQNLYEAWLVENQKYPASVENCLLFGQNTSTIYDNFNLINEPELTVSFWYLHDNSVNSSDRVLGSRDSVAYNFYVNVSRSGAAAVNGILRTNDGAGGFVNNSFSFGNISTPTVGWRLLTLTYNGSVIKAYVNNEEVDSLSATGTVYDLNPFIGGSRNYNQSIRDGNGSADGMRMSNVIYWNKALTPSELTTLYNNGTPLLTKDSIPQDSSMLLWNTLENKTETIGGGLYDKSGNSVSIQSITNPSNIIVDNVPVSAESVLSSGLTEQSLVNNNVSALNGESEGMNSTNLVQSNLTRTQPFSSYSIEWDAGTDYMDLPATTWTSGQTYTISMWMRKDSFGNLSGTPFVWAKGTTLTNIVLWWRTNATELTYTNGQNTNTVKSVQGLSLNDNEWYHFCFTATLPNVSPTTTDQKIYINGVEQTIGTPSSWISSNQSTSAIGRLPNNTGFNYNGLMSNVALFDSILTQDDIINLYNNGVTQDLNNFRITPSYWWPLDENYTYYDGSSLVARDVIGGIDADGNNLVQENIIGSAPGSEGNGTGTNASYANLKGDMYESKNNAYSINMADYADGVTNPANSGRSTEVPSV